VAWFKPHSILDKIFEAGVIIKGIEGVAETLAGVFVLGAGSSYFGSLADQITQQELQEDPGDWFANFIFHTGQHLSSGGTTFLVAYLLIHGVIKLVAVGSLLRNQLWGYWFSMITLGLFMLYQVYEVALKHSVAIGVLTVFDVFLMWLIYREYQIQKRLRRPDPPAQTA
jgi:uncharacterized membrane protein